MIHKPFNEIEVRNVLHNMEMSRAMQWLIVKARNDFCRGIFMGSKCAGTKDAA